MKKFIFSLILSSLFVLPAAAQAPQKINYQGIARNASGQPLANQGIGLKISIIDATPAGTALYVETFSVTTNAYGLYNVAIGSGTIVSGVFSTIKWSGADKYIKVEVDPAGGSAYVALGTTQLLSVPYALRAEDAGMITVYGSGTQNANKMVIQHSPNYPTWGLQYSDTTDKFRFLGNGINIFEVGLGSNKVVVNGSLQVTSGTPGLDKVLSSDANGNASWQDFSTKVSAFQPTGCQVLASATSTYQKIGDMGTFNKVSAGTLIELNLQTHVNVASFISANAVVFELRVDDVATTFGNATVLIRSNNTYEPVSITGVFSSLGTGNHTVSLWAKATNNGSATNVMWDAGCFNGAGTNNVLVKEFR